MDANESRHGGRIEAPPKPGGSGPAPSPPGLQNPGAAVSDWLRVQQMLLAAEKELAAMAERHARGEVTTEELDQSSEKTVALRELSLAVLQRLRSM